MIDTTEFKVGMTLLYEGKLLQIVEYQHIKPGKGGAFVKTRLRDLKNNTVLDRTFRSGDKFETAYIQQRNMHYLYNSGDSYFFMDTENYEQLHVDKAMLGKSINFLKENMEASLSFYEDRFMDIALPVSVELKITHTEPGIKGDTARATYKPATVETGAVVQVPLFVKMGDIIRIDTRTGEYLERA
ncbi:MAG: elongation factor P [Candidatus Omnitrophica bacterium]|nr:elongation factor P [Candidatus Omnitrophota bacterium]